MVCKLISIKSSTAALRLFVVCGGGIGGSRQSGRPPSCFGQWPVGQYSSFFIRGSTFVQVGSNPSRVRDKESKPLSFARI